MTQRIASHRDLRPIALPLYVAASMLVAIPLIEVGAQLGFTGRPDSLPWRTGTVGLLSSALLTPAFGLIVAAVIAFAFEHTRAHRILTWLSGFVALALVAVTAVFVLDALQLRSSLNPQVKHAFTIAMAKAVLNFGIASGALLVVCVSGVRAGRRDKIARGSRAEGGEVPLLVRR